jgi:predicted phage terminase large subunit-like protein
MLLSDVEQPNVLSWLQFHSRRRAAEESLLEFTKQGWKWAGEPSEFRSNRHIDCTCEHLEAVAKQQILRLLINIPPRHMKSLGANVFLPAWVWANRPLDRNGKSDPDRSVSEEAWLGPGVRFVHVTYKADLAVRHSVQCRQLIQSPWYQERWGHRYQLSQDQNEKTYFENQKGGSRFSGSMTGVTGRGGNIVVYDDPHDVMELESELSRNEVIRFWTEQLQNRVDPGPAAFIVIMQRLHANDLSGYIIANEFDAEYVDLSNAPWPPEKWRHICVPARFEEKHPHPLRTDLRRKGRVEVWTDDRKDGDALWPCAFPIKELDKREKGMTPYAIAGQMQQRPVARSGGLFKREWFGESQFLNPEQIPPGTKWVRGWDLAASEGQRADYTAGVKLGRMPDGRFIVGDVIRMQEEGHIVRDRIKATAAMDGRYCEIRLPKDPAQAGKVQAADFVRMLAGWVVHTEPDSGSKITRAEPLAAQASHGNLCLVRGHWNNVFLDELCMFPNATHSDQVDALSAAFARFVMQQGEFSVGWVHGLVG